MESQVEMGPAPQPPSDRPAASTAPAASAADLPVAPPTYPQGKQLPIAWLGAFILLAVQSGILVCLSSLDYESYGGDEFLAMISRWTYVLRALPLAALGLALAGSLEMLRNIYGPGRRGAQLVLGATIALFVSALGLEAFFRISEMWPGSAMQLTSMWIWLANLQAAAWLALSLGFVLCGGADRRLWRMTPFLFGLSLLAHPFSPYANLIFDWVGHKRADAYALSAVLQGTYLILAGITLRFVAPLPDSIGGWGRAARALARTGNALYARLWITGASVTLTLLLFSSGGADSSSTLTKLWTFGVPLGVALASFAMVSGVLGAAALAVPGAPRVHLTAAAALAAVVAVVSSVQLFHVFATFPDHSAQGHSLPVLLPALTLISLVALSLGLRRLSSLTLSLELSQRASSSTAVVVVSQCCAFGAQLYIESAPGLSVRAVVSLSLLITIASLFPLISLARMCHALAEELRSNVELPAATLRPRRSP